MCIIHERVSTKERGSSLKKTVLHEKEENWGRVLGSPKTTGAQQVLLFPWRLSE